MARQYFLPVNTPKTMSFTNTYGVMKVTHPTSETTEDVIDYLQQYGFIFPVGSIKEESVSHNSEILTVELNGASITTPQPNVELLRTLKRVEGLYQIYIYGDIRYSDGQGIEFYPGTVLVK